MALEPPLRVFVMGCSRGGTTVTQRLVAERLALHTLPETRFYASLIGNTEARMFPTTARRPPLLRGVTSRLREALGLSTGMEWRDVTLDAPRRRKWSPVGHISADFVTAMDGAAKAAGKAGWLEKTPFHVHYARQIARLIPDPWMIHLLRDPQETVASIRDAAIRYPQSWGVTYASVERAVDNWNASVADATAMLGAPRQIFLPYEAVARAPEAVMDRVARLMGHQGPASPLDASALVTSREGWKADVTGSVTPAASKWQTALTPPERQAATALIRPIPAALHHAMIPFLNLIPR